MMIYLKSLKFSIELGKNDTLIDLISSGKIMILSSTNAKKYINEIEKHVYKGIVTNSIPDELLFWLIELYQGIRDYKKALIILNNLKGKKNNNNTIDKINAYDAILTYQNGHHEHVLLLSVSGTPGSRKPGYLRSAPGYYQNRYH